MPTAPAGYTLRYATEHDVPTILGLIQELANYEHALDEVKATPEKLRATLSLLIPDTSSSSSSTAEKDAGQKAIGDGGSPQELQFTPGFAKTLLICIPDDSHSTRSSQTNGDSRNAGTQVVGMAMYFHNYSTWHAAPGIYLEELIVRPDFRGKGYGRILLKALGKECLRLGCKRLEWSVLKWNEPSIGFYESHHVGAKMMEEWATMRVDGEELERLGG